MVSRLACHYSDYTRKAANLCLDSTFGVRLYTPDGVLGVNSTNDWEENFEELSLQVSQKYPRRFTLLIEYSHSEVDGIQLQPCFQTELSS